MALDDLEHRALDVAGHPRRVTADIEVVARLHALPDQRALLAQAVLHVELLGLVEACKLTGELFDRGERKEARKRLKRIVKESEFGRAVSDVQKEVAAAVAATVVVTST